MTKFFKLFIWICLTLSISNLSFSKDNLYSKGVELFKTKKYDEARFLFERSIVLDPKHSEAYLYLAKIYKEKGNKKKEKKNLETTLLINPANEEAILMLMKIALEKTNYSEIKKLSKRFSKVCKKLCKENEQILKDLENLEPKNES
jgi:tetratricopeptide (TPR) repeat protein